jgi:phosphocarrier protein HPr
MQQPMSLSGSDNLDRFSREVTVLNEHGLHARPATKFVAIANRYNCDVRVFRHADELSEALEIDGKSIMAMLTLMATPGTVLRIDAFGQDAQNAVNELAQLVEDKFGEDEQ